MIAKSCSMIPTMENKGFEMISGNTEKTSSVTSEKVHLIEKENLEKKEMIGGVVVEKMVKDYIQGTKKRTESLAKEQLKITMAGKEKKNQRVSRVLESKFQNDLLHLLAPLKNKNLPELSTKIKKALVNNLGEQKNSVEIQREIDGVLVGVESCLKALESLQNETKFKENKDSWIGTNNMLDAEHKIDLIQGIENETGINLLNLVQVKSRNEGDQQIKEITDSHQQYINALPQLIGLLNIRESDAIAEKELIEDTAQVLDKDRTDEIQNQITLFGMVLDDYIQKHSTEKKNTNAAELYKQFQAEGGTLNPFTFIGILRNKKILNTYRQENYFTGDPMVETFLAETAHKIPYEEKESLMFYKQHHTKSILEATKITSTIMVKGEKVSVIELQNPLI